MSGTLQEGDDEDPQTRAVRTFQCNISGMDRDAALQKIRAIRALENPVLRPSPYLRDRYVDEFGVEGPVRVRDYQVRGIMNLLQVQDMILGDDTGLGKTLQVLNAIGYIWMKEPEYVPIVVTKKSSLYQWAAEADRFMEGMEVVTVDAEPFERDAIYRDFFLGHNPSRKRIMIMTYEVMWKDMEKSVVRDKTRPDGKDERKVVREAGKALRALRAAFREDKAAFEEKKALFKSCFDGRTYDVHAYLQDRLRPPESGVLRPKPPGWTDADEVVLLGVIAARDRIKSVESEIDRLKDVVAPPKVVPGLLSYAKGMLDGHDEAKIFLVMDEIHYLKNSRGKMHKAAETLAKLSDRKIGMTATPVQNRLMEFFALFRIIQPELFPKVTYFQNEYCITKLQPIGGGRKVPVVVGHSKNQLKKFVDAVEPYYLSRRKHEVAEELPELITRELTCFLSPEQEELYDLSEVGALETSADPDADKTELLKAMTMVQQACNAPQLLSDEDGNPYEGSSSKMETLLDILQENPSTKTIIFSRFEKMISLIQEELRKAKIPHVRITGKEDKAKDREEAKAKFQSSDSGVNVILITAAGSESINLHAAEHMVFVDNPWSWGVYVQLIGRPIRIGSRNEAVLVTHLIARRHGGGKTIDDYVIKTLRSKKSLADAVAGVSLKEGLKFTESDMAENILQMLKDGRSEDAKALVSAPKPEKKPVKKVQGARKPPPDVPSVKVTDLDLSDI